MHHLVMTLSHFHVANRLIDGFRMPFDRRLVKSTIVSCQLTIVNCQIAISEVALHKFAREVTTHQLAYTG